MKLRLRSALVLALLASLLPGCAGQAAKAPADERKSPPDQRKAPSEPPSLGY